MIFDSLISLYPILLLGSEIFNLFKKSMQFFGNSLLLFYSDNNISAIKLQFYNENKPRQLEQKI